MRVFLIGFMGSGKSHWGKKWAAKNAFNFFDLDEIIEQQEQMTIAKIFEKKGEEYFREKESLALRNLQKQENCIIACGGGTPCYDNNLNWMNENGLTIYLNAKPKYLLENIIHEIDKRPLLKKTNPSELLFFIEQKLNERTPIYQKAKVILDTELLNENTIIEYTNQN
jgi:shikimate kinase